MSYYNYSDIVPFETLKGLTLTEIKRDGDEEISYVASDGQTFKMVHMQDCCETVEIDDIVGDLDDLVGSPIVRAEERKDNDCGAKEDYDESYTWTFYELATVKGCVTIKWYGSSNGYYSEGVDLIRLRDAA
ncbi:hypothetical protein ABC766_00230 [Methylobacterium fujisawaense]|uniref:DUF7448 domain-containing protein n=1 Tax=Methylobacterium fujisawaense TaxID=107400 RepID=UPI0031F50AF4